MIVKPLSWALALCLASTALPAAPLDPARPTAFFGITFIDTSTEGAINGARQDEADRLALVERYVRTYFEEQGFAFVDIAPVREELDRTMNPSDCNGCQIRMAQRLGAGYALVGEVQKVSNLILSMNLVVYDATTGAKMKGISVDVRSNTDDSWTRGMRYILRNAIFKAE